MVNEKVEWEFLNLKKDVGVDDEIVHKITAGIKKINRVQVSLKQWTTGCLKKGIRWEMQNKE